MMESNPLYYSYSDNGAAYPVVIIDVVWAARRANERRQNEKRLRDWEQKKCQS